MMTKTPTLLPISPEPHIKVNQEIWAHRGWRAVFSFPVVLACLLTVLTVLTVRARFNDPDLWYHLKIGEIIWNTHSIPRVDHFSFTAYGHPWVAQEWLSQVTLYGVYQFGGYTGLMMWLCAVSSLLIIGAYLLCTLYSKNAKVAFLGGLITWLFSTIGLSIRPHLLGYTLLICELLVLHLGRSRNTRWFWALPLLFALWINMHGSFFFGLVVLAILLFCSFLDIQWGLIVSRPWERSQRNTLMVATLLSVGALFLNPIGLRLVVNPIEVSNLHMNLTQVQEWMPPRFDEFRGLALLAITGLILIVPLLRRLELTVEELLLTGLGFSFALRHERMLFVFGILAAPVVCRLLADLWEGYEPDQDHPIANAIVIGVTVFVIGYAFPSGRELDRQVKDGNPVKALEYIKHSGLSGRILNDYLYGGYLIWAAPQFQVFIDGRGDIFESTGVLAEYLDWLGLQTNPNLLLEKYHIDFCLLSQGAPVGRVLPLLPGWKLVYSDQLSKVFVRRT
jgi:hypothetical protein